MSHKTLIISSAVLALAVSFSPGSAEDIRNYTILETIKIPNQITDPDFNFNDKDKLVRDRAYQNIGKPPKEKKLKNKICKKFGPIELDFKVKPFNMNRTGLVLNVDLLQSYQILSSHQSMNEIKAQFKPSKDHNIISDQVKNQYSKIKTWFNHNDQEAS